MPSDPGATRRSRKLWDRSASTYDVLQAPMERMLGLAAARAEIFQRAARRRVLEVGMGPGKNVRHYSDGPVVAIDLSPRMLARAVRKARDRSAAAHFAVADAEDLPFKDGSFDVVIATCVFCSVPDPVRGLTEVRRVLRTSGEVVLLEHMRPGGLLGRLFDLLDPAVSRLGGFHINRHTLHNIRKAGLVVEEERNLFSDWVKLIVARSLR
jgi:ubiquinone/menaquinone biosynthesis C-methylase UbiE